MSLRSYVTYFTVVGYIGISGCSVIEILGVAGDIPASLVDLKFKWRNWISSDVFTVSYFLISLYIWYILCNMIQSSLGSLSLYLMLIILGTLICPSLLFFLYLLCASSETFTHFTTVRKYLSAGISPYMLVLTSLIQKHSAVHIISYQCLWETHDHLLSLLMQPQILIHP